MKGRPLPEHEIGIAVFGRDRASYYTGDDPIVRVQAGRLRNRLSAYYGAAGHAETLHIVVPHGNYVPRFERRDPAPRESYAEAAAPLFLPLACLSPAPAAHHFTSGLNDELGYRLYRSLPAYRLHTPDGPPIETGPLPNSLVLAGSVRQDASRIRVSLHLKQAAEGTVVWYEQFDSAGDGSISDQEQLAERCLQALQRHLAARDGKVTAGV